MNLKKFINDITAANEPATATKLTYCCFAKALPLLQLQARR